MSSNLALVVSNDAQSLIENFLSGKSKRTIEAYAEDLEAFSKFLGESSPAAAISRFIALPGGQANQAVAAYKNHLVDRGLSSATVNRRLAAIRSITTLARTFGMITWMLEIKNLKTVAIKDTAGPGESGIVAMFRKLEERTDAKGIRDLAIVHLLYSLALRRSELTQLDLEDLDLSRGTLNVLGKGRREKEALSVPEATRAALIKWLQVRGDSPGPLFSSLDHARKGSGRLDSGSIYRIVRKLGEDCGIQTRSHALRHASVTAACKLAAENAIPIEEILAFSRHKSLATLLLYRDGLENSQQKISDLVSKHLKSKS